eukprot:Unigene9508_Nuclearia_a/m.29035 Unigene9508_Nuclearia_a/g.29035  ORF Unigene9508_Nuclearia_a/g.29035 Unigene9508_Nuclearia_a/m.29035 type:complete len:130 (-) Unigene9508_Nuclearia_a:896-1285(-)
MLQVGYRVAYLAVGPLALVALAVAWMYLWQVLPVALVLLGARAVQVHWRRAQRDPLRWKVPEPQAKSLTTRDGVRLSYYVVRGRTEQVVMIAPGLFVPWAWAQRGRGRGRSHARSAAAARPHSASGPRR